VNGDFRDEFWAVVCDFETVILAALGIDAFLLLLGLVSVFGVERGSASFVILVVDLVLLVPLFFVTLFLYWRCRTFTAEERF
jgi:hypothetical protein